MTKNKLAIDMLSILDAMTSPGEDPTTAWLDLQTGNLVYLSPYDDEDDLNDAIDESPEHYIRIERVETREQYDWMISFTDGIDEPDVHERLALALRGKGAFGRFRAVLHGYPDLRARWFDFEREKLLGIAERALHDAGIEPIYELPKPKVRADVLVRERGDAGPRTEGGLRLPSQRLELFDLLLLGAPDGKTELIGGQVLRQIVTASPPEARGAFKRLAREICEGNGLGWRKRFIEGKSTYELGRMHLSVRDAVVELRVDVDKEIWDAFAEHA